MREWEGEGEREGEGGRTGQIRNPPSAGSGQPAEHKWACATSRIKNGCCHIMMCHYILLTAESSSQTPISCCQKKAKEFQHTNSVRHARKSPIAAVFVSVWALSILGWKLASYRAKFCNKVWAVLLQQTLFFAQFSRWILTDS